MDKSVSEEEAKDRIEEMVNDCADNGTRYAILSEGKEVAYLIPWTEYEELVRNAEDW